MQPDKEIRVPDVGDHDSLELMRWLLAEGDEFEAGDEICELVTDKAVFPIEAEAKGKLTKITTGNKSQVKVDQVIGSYVYYDEN